ERRANRDGARAGCGRHVNGITGGRGATKRFARKEPADALMATGALLPSVPDVGRTHPDARKQQMNRSMNPVAATRLLILGAALAAVTAACGAGFNVTAAGAADPGANGVAVPSPAAVSAELDVARIAKDLRAASARHDTPTANADQELLASRLGRAQLESLDSTYRLALADV